MPLDSRPAVTQYPQLIGDIASVKVETPPDEILGRFTTPGKPSAIADWLLQQDLTNVSAVIVSSDMICYGGLIASRVPDISRAAAIQNLRCLEELRKKRPGLQIFVFSALMRTAPTATDQTRAWRMNLARYMELKDRYATTKEKHLPAQIQALKKKIPAVELEKYLAARQRNMEVHKQLLRMTKSGIVNYLVVGADDAQKYGPHVQEIASLKKSRHALAIDGSAFFCEGVDQHANLLVSRALLRLNGWTPQVFVKLSQPKAAVKPAVFESQPLGDSIRDQIIASGARQAPSAEKADYILYLNTPGTKEDEFNSFAVGLCKDIENSGAIAVADINFDKQGSADSRLISELWRQEQAGNLLAFAGWNTAGNTIGTAVPQSNMYLLAKRIGTNPVHREKSHRLFLLHRLVNDYGYHKYIRPAAYKMIDDDPYGTREEAHGRSLEALQEWVARNTESLLQKYFREQFEQRPFDVDGDTYRISAIKDVQVRLPWPRAFEVRIDFDLEMQQVAPAIKLSGRGG